jgi:hypothetical protein
VRRRLLLLSGLLLTLSLVLSLNVLIDVLVNILINVLLLVVGLIKSRLLLLSSLVVDIIVSLVVVDVVDVSKLLLPDATEGSSRVFGNGGPSGLSTEELDTVGGSWDGDVVVETLVSTEELVLEVVEAANTTEDVLGDESLLSEN